MAIEDCECACNALGGTLACIENPEQNALVAKFPVGLYVIGNYLTEINVTSPTGLQELRRFDGTDGAALIWDAIERRFSA